MKIVVLVKQVLCADRVGLRAQLDQADEIAVDQALRIALRRPDVQITAVTVGPVVAIDRDPAAPIFRVADLGVVGDVHQVVPELLAEIKRRKAQPVNPEA